MVVYDDISVKCDMFMLMLFDPINIFKPNVTFWYDLHCSQSL